MGDDGEGQGCGRGCAWIAGVAGGGAALVVVMFAITLGGSSSSNLQDIGESRVQTSADRERRQESTRTTDDISEWREQERRRLERVRGRQGQVNAPQIWYTDSDFEIVSDRIPAPGLNTSLYKRSIQVRLSKCGTREEIERVHGLVLAEAIGRSGATEHGVVIFYLLPGMESGMYARTSRIEGWPFIYGSIVTDQPPRGQTNSTGRGAWSLSLSSNEWVMVCNQEGEVVTTLDPNGWAVR